MVERVLTGTRIRNRRLDLGLRQADVARQLSISGSYLNLIEHNRRRIGEALLERLARVLDIDPLLLEDGSAETVIGPLMEAANAMPEAGSEQSRAEDMVARFPGWAGLIAAQSKRIKQLEQQAQMLSDRLSHDTQIATSLHEVISTATAIRSTASILVETPDLDRDWQGRFHTNIDNDAARLAESSQALLGFLDMEVDASGTQVDVAEAALAEHAFYVAEADEQRLPDLSKFDDVTGEILKGWFMQTSEDAKRLPLVAFEQAARVVAYDPARLADLPRAGTACPLWPMYQSLSQPGRPVRRIVQMPGVAHTPFECIAISTSTGSLSYDVEPRITATMLVRPAKIDEEVSTVGPGCRICTVTDCESRRHPSIV